MRSGVFVSSSRQRRHAEQPLSYGIKKDAFRCRSTNVACEEIAGPLLDCNGSKRLFCVRRDVAWMDWLDCRMGKVLAISVRQWFSFLLLEEQHHDTKRMIKAMHCDFGLLVLVHCGLLVVD